MGVLSEEGLTAKRLSVTAKRLQRASDYLDGIARKTIASHILELNTKRAVYNSIICDLHSEILMRIILKAIEQIGQEREYSPRLERVENLVEALRNEKSFRKRTLGGVIFERNDKKKQLILTCENQGQK